VLNSSICFLNFNCYCLYFKQTKPERRRVELEEGTRNMYAWYLAQ